MKFLGRAKMLAERDTVDAYRAVGAVEITVWRCTFVHPDETLHFIAYAFDRRQLPNLTMDLWLMPKSTRGEAP